MDQAVWNEKQESSKRQKAKKASVASKVPWNISNSLKQQKYVEMETMTKTVKYN